MIKCIAFSEFPVPAEGRTFDVAQPLLFHLLDCICKVTLKSGTSKVVPEFSHGGCHLVGHRRQDGKRKVKMMYGAMMKVTIYTLSPD